MSCPESQQEQANTHLDLVLEWLFPPHPLAFENHLCWGEGGAAGLLTDWPYGRSSAGIRPGPGWLPSVSELAAH